MLGIKQIILAILIGLLGTACRTSQPSDTARIHAQKSSELIAWLNPEWVPDNLKDRDVSFFQAVCDELVTRHEVDFLLASLDTSTNDYFQEWLLSGVLCQINDRKIYDNFASRLDDKEDEESYYIADYLARRGNTGALATLNRHYYRYPVSSWQWSYTVELLGKYRYKPATTNLVKSLDAASLNVSAAACNGLQDIFPDSPRHFSGPTEAKNYYLKRLKGL